MLNQSKKKKENGKTAEEESASTPSMSAAVPATASATAHTETERIRNAIGSNDEMADSREDAVDDEMDGGRPMKPYNPFPSNPYGYLSLEVSSERVAHRTARSAGETGQHATSTQSEKAVSAGNSAAQSDAVAQATTPSATPEAEDTVESILTRSEERAMAEVKTLKKSQALFTAATEAPPVEMADKGTMTVDYDLTAEVHELRENLMQQAKELRGVKSRHGEAMKKREQELESVYEGVFEAREAKLTRIKNELASGAEREEDLKKQNKELESVYEGLFEAREAKLTQLKNELASGANREKDLKKQIKELEREKANAEQRFESEQRAGKALSDQLYGAHEKNNELIDERDDLTDRFLQVCTDLAEHKSHSQPRQASSTAPTAPTAPNAPPALDIEKMVTLERRLGFARNIIKTMGKEKEELQRQLDEAMAAPDKLKTQLRNEHERVAQLQDSNRRLREQIARDSGKQPHGGIKRGGKRGGWGGGMGGGGLANW